MKLFEEDIREAIKVLKKGGTILYPTDTIWGIGCDATNGRAVNKVYRIKKRTESKNLIILLDDKEKLTEYVKVVPEIAWDFIESIKTALTIVYPNAKKLAKSVVAGDKTIGIRIAGDDFCRELIKEYGKPIVSTSANISGEDTPLFFNQIPDEIKEQVDYIVNVHRERVWDTRPSTIIKINDDGSYEILR